MYFKHVCRALSVLISLKYKILPCYLTKPAAQCWTFNSQQHYQFNYYQISNEYCVGIKAIQILWLLWRTAIDCVQTTGCTITVHRQLCISLYQFAKT